MVLLDTGIARELAMCLANRMQRNMSERDYQEHMHRVRQEKSFSLPDVFVLLCGDVSFCSKNIAQRGRPEEQGLTGEYLSAIERAHQYILHPDQHAKEIPPETTGLMDLFPSGGPVCTIDLDQPDPKYVSAEHAWNCILNALPRTKSSS